MRDQLLVSWMGLMSCIPGLNTAHLKELLLKLLIPAVEKVPGLTMSEAVEVTYYIPCCIALLLCVLVCMCDPQDCGLGARAKPGQLPALYPKQSTCLL